MSLENEKNRWETEVYAKSVQKAPQRKEKFETTSRIEIPPILTPAETDYSTQLGFPGEYPFTRGVQPTMYRGRFWTMRQYAGFATPRNPTGATVTCCSQGQTGLSVAFDLPTQIGYDADDPISG